MNKLKTHDRGFSFLEIVILIAAAAILMTAGVGHAWLKNSQVAIVREMDQTQRRIHDQEDVINSLQVKIDKKLNIYELRDNLEKANSELVMLPASAIEKIPAHPTRLKVDAVATATNPKINSAIAQRSP